MEFITHAQAEAHTHSDGVDAEMLALYAGAAELAAMNFINRRVFADKDSLALAIDAIPAALADADAAYDAAREAAYLLDGSARAAALSAACAERESASERARETYAGIVITDDIVAAMLLILGHLFRNREDVITGETVAQVPMGAHALLWPYRRGLGV